MYCLGGFSRLVPRSDTSRSSREIKNRQHKSLPTENEGKMENYKKSQNSIFSSGMHTTSLMVTLALIFFSVGTVQATTVTIDPDTFPDGSDISNAFDGVTLSSIGSYNGPGAPLDGHVYALTSDFASTGTNVFGNNLPGTTIDDTPGSRLWYQSSDLAQAYRLRVDFDNPANYVSIDFISNNGNDQGILEAYDSMGNLLSSVIAVSSGAPHGAEIIWPSFDIAYVIASGTGGEALCLDNLQANVVPEPATVLLVGLGGLLLLRRGET
jgi:hypothetical protein